MMQPDPLQQCERTFVRYCGRKLSYFSGCDYFRLASDPRVVSAFKRATDQYGINVAASRFTTGNHDLYRSLERHLASFFDVQDALLVSTGYMSNLVTAQALARSFSHALIDARSHSSLQEAAQLLECPVLMFAHRSPEDVARCLRRCGTQSRSILLTDGMFSHDGSIAPLDRYLQILPPDSLILVDDAHGAGVIGKCGRGAAEHCGVDRKRIVQTITLSKGFGVYGGAMLGTKRLTGLVLQRSHMLVGSTPVPLPL